jgi:hypothetical protein
MQVGRFQAQPGGLGFERCAPRERILKAAQTYRMGINLLDTVVKLGKVVHRREPRPVATPV